MALTDFTLANARRFYSSKGNPLDGKGLKGKKNGVVLFVVSHLVPEIFKIAVLCKLGTNDVIRCDNMEVKTRIENIYIPQFFIS